MTSASSRDRVEVAQLGQPGEAERVEAVAGEQREVGIVGPHDAAGAVVLQVALDDRLDEQRVVLLAAGGARPGRGGGAQRPVGRRRVGDRLGHQPAVGAQRGREPVERAHRHAISRERRRRDLERAGDVLGRVGERREPGLELRRRRVHAAGQQRAAPGAVGLGVARGGAGVVAHGLRAEEHGQQARAPTRPAPGRPPAASRRPVGERLGRRGQVDVGVLVEQLERRAARRRPRAGSRSACRPGRRRRPARSGSSARPSRRRPRPAARRRSPCPSP